MEVSQPLIALKQVNLHPLHFFSDGFHAGRVSWYQLYEHFSFQLRNFFGFEVQLTCDLPFDTLLVLFAVNVPYFFVFNLMQLSL